MSDELIGKTLGGYEILDRIDQGGMATVYRARQTSMNRVVALKVLPRHFLRDDTYLRRFEREVEIIAQLEHRNIVPVYDYGQTDNQPYIAMRYMPAGSVNDLLHEGPIHIDRVLEIIEQVAPALDYAHSKHILHRDLKPSNILLDEAGDAYITDFGIARITGLENKGTTITTQGVVGTPAYMSPEQAQGKSMDGRSDVYSLGVMLFEMVTGRRPFENDTPYGIAVMHVTTQPPSPRSVNEDVSVAVEQVIFKALKKLPENRYNTANELAQALKMAVERPTSVHDTEPSGIPIGPALEATQPASAQPRLTGETVPSPPAQRIALVPRTPQPPVYGAPSSARMAPLSSGLRGRIRSNRRSPASLVLTVLLGMVIGCGLLSVLVAALIFTLNNLFNQASATISVTQFPTLDATSEAARQALVPGAGNVGDPDATPVFSNATPIPTRTATPGGDEVVPVGARPTATFVADFPASFSRVVYFADRDGDYDIFSYDLISGQEEVLVEGDATDSYPQVSPDGSMLAFQSDSDGDFEIYVRDLNSGETTRLTDNDVRDRTPAWSPDGAWIVYSSDTRDNGSYDLVMARPDGSDTQVIYSDGSRNSHPRFSGDGRYVVFTSGTSDATTWEIMLFNLREGTVAPLTDNDVRDSSPVFSPDGSSVVHVTEGEGGSAIAVIDLNGDAESSIIHDGAGYEWGAHYSPDGRFIIFNDEINGGVVLKLMRADGTDVHVIENAGGFYPSWVS